MRLDTSNFPGAGIACANIGGTDVIRSAERAPLRPAPFDRLAVGVITAANSEVGNPATLTSAVLMQEPNVEAEGQGRVMQEHGREEGSQSRLPSDPVENKADGPSVIAVVFSSPDPRTSEGADGHLGIPSPNVAGAKSDSADPLSSVGPAQGLDHGYRQLGQAVPYSPWTVRRSSNSFRSTYP